FTNLMLRVWTNSSLVNFAPKGTAFGSEFGLFSGELGKLTPSLIMRSITSFLCDVAIFKASLYNSFKPGSVVVLRPTSSYVIMLSTKARYVQHDRTSRTCIGSLRLSVND